MDSFDDMDIEDMINNPFQNINIDGNTQLTDKPEKGVSDLPKGGKWDIPKKKSLTEEDYQRMAENHPLDDRVLSLEKNIIITDNKLETIKRIIEQQNERISNIEEELDLLRKQLGGEAFTIEDSPDE